MADRLFVQALAEVHREWGRPAFEMLGSRIQRALVAEAVLGLAALQDDTVPDAKVRHLVTEGRWWAYEVTGY